MTRLEIIDRLCRVTRLQADIIYKQAEALAQAEIAEAVADELRSMRKAADDELDIVEYGSREYIATGN